MLEYTQGAELPDTALPWLDADGDIIDFSSGYTFEAKVGTPGSAAVFTKTTGITGAATTPNVTVEWATSDELSELDPGIYVLQVKATRSADSKDRFGYWPLRINPAIT